MIPLEISPTVEDKVLLEWMVGGIAAFLVFLLLANIVYIFQADNQQRTISGVAIVGGVVISLGLSPFGDFASVLAGIFEVVPDYYPEWIRAFVYVESVLGLLYGLLVMAESGGLFAVASFIVALIGGVFLPYYPFLGIIVILFSWLLMELSPASHW